jgi:eukaryotic-like serine/threonine-protein kinase
MANHIKRVAPRAETPVPGDTGRTTTRLPDDLMNEQVRRLAIFSGVAGGLWAFGFAMDVAIVPLVFGRPTVLFSAVAIEIVWMLLAAMMFAYARFADDRPARKMDVGLGYMVLNAVGIALLNTWGMLGQDRPLIQLSWIVVLVLIYSMIAPTSPGKMFAASVISATMDPLAVWAQHLAGVDVPSVAMTIVMFLPNYVCAVVAVLPARLFQRMGRRIQRAEELGSYQLTELLGQGGMGEVWRAKHQLLARDAAIKLVRPEVLGAHTPEDAALVLRRFEREAQATASLSSPHTIQVFDFGLTKDGTFYYVMELLNGRDLESLVRAFGPMPADRAIYLLRQVCHSLADAHARGLVHRDIKPANIYICRMGLEYDFVKVLDFGLVKLDGRPSVGQTLLTVDHTTTGTPAYMAPEVILGEADVDRCADVYALGCVAYYLLTGQLVFEGDTPMKILMQHVHARPVPPSQRTELPVPRELDDLVLACLEKNPRDRPQDARELWKAACRCTSCDTWDNEAARAWWERHLPEITAPPALHDSGRATRSVVATV